MEAAAAVAALLDSPHLGAGVVSVQLLGLAQLLVLVLASVSVEPSLPLLLLPSSKKCGNENSCALAHM